MSTTIAPILRRGARSIGWVLLAVIGFVAFLMAGWIPPELAAMLGSRMRWRRP